MESNSTLTGVPRYSLYIMVNNEEEVKEMSRPKGTNKRMRIKVHAILVHKAAQFVNELNVKQDLADVVFDYAQQKIEVFDSDGNYVSSRKFSG